MAFHSLQHADVLANGDRVVHKEIAPLFFGLPKIPVRLSCMSATDCNEDSRKKNLEAICWSFQALCASAYLFLFFLMLPTWNLPKPIGPKKILSHQQPTLLLAQVMDAFLRMTHGAKSSRRTTTRIAGNWVDRKLPALSKGV